MASSPKLVEIDGFFVEVSEGPAMRGRDDGLQRTGARSDEAEAMRGGSTEAALDRVEKLRGTIARVCSNVRSAFVEANHPDELKVSFGIKLGGELGVPFVSRGTGEASIIVEATWKKADTGQEAE